VQQPDEIFDVVDEADRIVGRATRSAVHADKLRHRAIHVFVFNEHGKLFIQKRSQSKDSYPGRYDSSASGHLNSGEDYDACAVRELAEELGLTIPPENLQKHFKIEGCPHTGREFVWVYSLQTSEVPRINPHEIQSGTFWSRAQIRASVASRPGEFAPSFLGVFQEFDRRELWPEAQ
jgi:isopentenyl-diphosphate delta-isomerase type 1